MCICQTNGKISRFQTLLAIFFPFLIPCLGIMDPKHDISIFNNQVRICRLVWLSCRKYILTKVCDVNGCLHPAGISNKNFSVLSWARC